LQGDCEKLAGAFTALAAAAGDAGVESAARSAGTSALRQFLNMTSGYQHTAQGLAVCAATYARAESSATEAVTGIGPGRRPLNGLFRPAGDPAALEEAAGSLRSCAGQVAALGASTRSTGGRIAAGADWTGASADAYAQFTSSFAADMEGMEQPLRSVPGAVAGYAAALREAQGGLHLPLAGHGRPVRAHRANRHQAHPPGPSGAAQTRPGWRSASSTAPPSSRTRSW